jgi:hypothetical protein
VERRDRNLPRRQSEGSCDQSDKEGAELTRTAVVGRHACGEAHEYGQRLNRKCEQRPHRNPRLTKLKMMPITIMVVASETQV